ncbi:hypothetical protein [Frog virus 3]
MLNPLVTDRFSLIVLPGSLLTLMPSIEFLCRVGCLLRATGSPSTRHLVTVMPGSSLGHENGGGLVTVSPVFQLLRTTDGSRASYEGLVTLPRGDPSAVSMWSP